MKVRAISFEKNSYTPTSQINNDKINQNFWYLPKATPKSPNDYLKIGFTVAACIFGSATLFAYLRGKKEALKLTTIPYNINGLNKVREKLKKPANKLINDFLYPYSKVTKEKATTTMLKKGWFINDIEGTALITAKQQLQKEGVHYINGDFKSISTYNKLLKERVKHLSQRYLNNTNELMDAFINHAQALNFNIINVTKEPNKKYINRETLKQLFREASFNYRQGKGVTILNLGNLEEITKLDPNKNMVSEIDKILNGMHSKYHFDGVIWIGYSPKDCSSFFSSKTSLNLGCIK